MVCHRIFGHAFPLPDIWNVAVLPLANIDGEQQRVRAIVIATKLATPGTNYHPVSALLRLQNFT
jgi:hypothetical protein